jgi:acetyl-CoA carboxylase carboxyl transferase subunit alpha
MHGGLRAIHVDHGLHPDSSAWAARCRETCAALGVPIEVVREPIGGAHRNPVQMGRRLKAVLLNELDMLEQLPVDALVQRRYERLRGYGAYEAA